MTRKLLSKYISAAVAVFICAVGNAETASDSTGIFKRTRNTKTKAALVKENRELSMLVDSLTAEIGKYRTEIREKDSLTAEILEIYEENEDKNVLGLSPEEYTPEVTDSLLNLWYLHKKMSTEDFVPEYDMDTVRFESNVPDSVYIQRLKAMNSFIDLPYNSIVRNYIILYSEKMSGSMPELLGLCSYYMPIFEEIFNEHDMPEELKALAVIESALNPTAVSRAGAKGMWQFMYSTAKLYGLTIDSFVDERFDPVKSAHAVAAYLEDAYNIFGDWNLAIASYNCGAGNVNKAIRRSGGRRAFWDIYPYLPRETSGYVPAFVGALYTMTYYKEHGIVPETIRKGKSLTISEIVAPADDGGKKKTKMPKLAGNMFTDATDISELGLSDTDLDALIAELTGEMRAAAESLEFERAADLRDQIRKLRPQGAKEKPGGK